MLIIRKNQTNNLIATVSMNKTLPNPYYLFSFQHITSKERVSFIPEVITSNVRYDKFRFNEAQVTNLSTTPPQINFPYIGQWYYAIYEQLSPTNTDIEKAFNKLESGRAVVIVGNDQEQECFFEPYISNNEIFENVIYISEQEEECINPPLPPVCSELLTGDCPTFLAYTYPSKLLFKSGDTVPTIYEFDDTCSPAGISFNSNTNKMYMVDGCSNYYDFDYTITSGGCFSMELVNKWKLWDTPEFTGTPNASYGIGVYDDNTIIVGSQARFVSQTGTTFYLYDLTTSGLTEWLQVGNNASVDAIYYNTGNTQSILVWSQASGSTTYYSLYTGSTNPQFITTIVGSSISGYGIYFSGNTAIAVNNAGLQWVLDFVNRTATLLESGGLPIKYVDEVDGDLNYSYLGMISTPVSCYNADIPNCALTQYLNVELLDSTKFKLSLWENQGYTIVDNAICDYVISGVAYGSMGTVFYGTETISQGQHLHQFDLKSVLLPGEIVVGFDVISYELDGCDCFVDIIFPIPPTPSPTPSFTPTMTPTITPTLTPTITPSSTPAPFDSDAAVYLADVLTAGGTLNSTISGATNTLFTDLKSSGLYSKMFAFYPMIGGTANSIGIQGKRTLGTTHDINWFGGWSYSVSGASGNAINTYATFAISGGTLPATNSHLSVYGNLPNNNTSGYDLSINLNNGTGQVQQIILDFQASSNGYYEYTGYAAVTGGDTGDFVIMSRNTAGTETIRARNGIALANKLEDCNDIDNTREWKLGVENAPNGANLTSTSNRYCWVGFGSKLTPSELLTYQSIINTFQTTLGRNTY